MGLIKALFLKRIGPGEESGSKVAKIFSIVFYIAALLVIMIGTTRLLKTDFTIYDFQMCFFLLLLWGVVLILIGGAFDLRSEIITIKREIKDLKDKTKE